jgi:lipopolysaccharide biosynthesis glycosyltransferase
MESALHVAAYSALVHASEPVHFWIMSSDVNTVRLALTLNKAGKDFDLTDSPLSCFPTARPLLYLSADVRVKCDLSSLLHTDMNGIHLGAAEYQDADGSLACLSQTKWGDQLNDVNVGLLLIDHKCTFITFTEEKSCLHGA